MSDGLIAGIIALLIAVFTTVAAFFQEPFNKWRSRPKLKFEFKLDSPFCHKTVGKGERPVYCFLFQITNSGKTVARNCEATIEEVSHKTDRENYEKEKNFSSVNLVWSNRKCREKQYRNINPGQRIACDLGLIYEFSNDENTDNQKFKFYLFSPPLSQKDYLLPGKHKLKVSIYSENAKAVHASFIISWSGQWRDDEQEIFKECKIEML